METLVLPCEFCSAELEIPAGIARQNSTWKCIECHAENEITHGEVMVEALEACHRIAQARGCRQPDVQK